MLEVEYMMDRITDTINNREYINRLAKANGWQPCYSRRDAREGVTIGDFEETVRRLLPWQVSRFFWGHVLWYMEGGNERVEAIVKTQNNVGMALAWGGGSRPQRFWWWLATGSRYRGVCHA